MKEIYTVIQFLFVKKNTLHLHMTTTEEEKRTYICHNIVLHKMYFTELRTLEGFKAFGFNKLVVLGCGINVFL